MSEAPGDTLETRFAEAVKAGDKGPALDAMREALAGFDVAGADAVAQMLHTDVEIDLRPLLLDGRVYHGVAGFRRWRSDMAETWEYDRFEPQAVRFADGNRVVVFGRVHTKGRESAVETDVPLIHVYEMQDGKVRGLTMYSDARDALEAVGLRE